MTKTNQEARDDERCYGMLVRELRDAQGDGTDWVEDLISRAADAIETLRKHPEPEITEDFIAWSDRSPAVTWTGKMGLKERWVNRNNPEYQEMLRKVYGEE